MDVLFGLDTETERLQQYRSIEAAPLNPHLSRIRLIQICTGKSVVVLDMHNMWASGLVMAQLREFLEGHKFVAHNALFDLQFLRKWVGTNHINIGCTFILWKIITHATRPTDAGIRSSLGILTEKLLDTTILKEEGKSDWSVPDLDFAQIEYSAIDAICVLELAKKMAPAMERLGITKYYKLCKAAQHPLAEMQLNGIGFNVDAHRELSIKWVENLWMAKKDLVKITGLTKTTPMAIGDYLKKHLSSQTLAIWPLTEKGKLSTDASTLLEFEDSDPVVKPFAVFNKLQTLTTSFGENLIETVNPATKRIHAGYNICGARTGRLSCSHPNLQQMPRDDAIRANFIAAPGMLFLDADYSQIEIRVGAELSQDERMLEAYRNGVDLHSLTASIVGHKSISALNKEDRQKAKAFNFGLMFGLGPTKFAKYAKKSYQVDVTQDEAEESIKTWRKTYYGYRAWQVKQAEDASVSLHVRTPTGKLRCLDPENTYGAAMNTPVQGGACECMLAALVSLHESLTKGSLKTRMINVVHDEIITEGPPSEKELVKDLITIAMTNGFKYVFPNGVTKGLCTVGEGATWKAAKE